jgi:WD40 repeat protein
MKAGSVLTFVVLLAVSPAPAADEPAGSAAPRLLVDAGGFSGPVGGLAFRPDGAWLAAGGDDKTVRIWEMATGRLRYTLRGEEGTGALGACTAVAFSPNGEELVVGVQDYTPQGAIRVYRTADLSQIAQLLPGHEQGGVTGLAFSADGKYLASVGADNQVIVWDWPARRAVRQAAVEGNALYVGFPRGVPALAVIDDQGAHAWSVVHGKDLFSLTAAEAKEVAPDFNPQTFADEIQRQTEWLARVALPDNGQRTRVQLDLDIKRALIAGIGKRDGRDRYWVGLWSIGEKQPSQVYTQHRYRPWALAHDPTHGLVASADLLGEVHVWDAGTGQSRYRFTSAARPIYRVGFDPSGKRLAFGAKSFETGRFQYNHYADLEETFELENRRILEGASGAHQTEVIEKGERALSLGYDRATNVYSLACAQRGRIESRYTLPPGVRPMCYSFLRSARPGFGDGVLIGRRDNVLTCMEPRTMLSRREFVGHQGEVTALSESADRRFLATACADGIIRIWSLERFQTYAFPDFDAYSDGIVNYVVPGGPSDRAGIRIGDQFLGMDGRDVSGLMESYLAGKWPYRPQQRTSVQMARAGKRYEAQVELVPSGDFAEPLLSLFTTATGDWVIWTPQGYYDASLGGDRLIGWHVNQGRSRAAKFYLAEQFRKQFYRPDVIDRLLETGDVTRAIALANRNRSAPAEPLYPRRSEVVKRIEPPSVRILEPADGARTREAEVSLRAEIRSENELPLSEITVLVNGRPVPQTEQAAAGSRTLGRTSTLERRVTLLPGRNEIAVVASNRASSSRPALITVNYESGATGAIKPNLYLLAVGVSRYARSDLRNLQFADRDAIDFADAWKRQEGVEYQKVEVRLITNDQATSQNVLKGMEWLVRSTTQKDVAILFLAAHGLLDARRNYYLATHDIDPKSPRGTAVRWSEVKSLIDDLPGRFLLFVDTCHSGGITGEAPRGLDVVDDPLRDLVTEATGAVVFASCLAREVSLEDARWGHGAFTKAVLDVLADPASDLNHDGFLSLTELDYQISEHVKGLTEGRQHASRDWPPTVPNYTVFQFAQTKG